MPIPKVVGKDQHMGILWNIGDRRFGDMAFIHEPTRGGSIMAKKHRILSFLVCITLVTAFLGCASTPTRESTGEYVDEIGRAHV